MKKVLSALIISNLFILTLHSQIPHVKWWYNTKDFSAGQATAGDIDNDGKLEVVFSCYRNDSTVYALNAENGTLLWKYNTSPGFAEGCNDVAPIIYDVDNNGTKNVVLPSSCNPKTFCFNGPNGAITWTCNTKGSDSPPSIADIDNDGLPEILHGEFQGYVMCINAENGTQNWEILVDANSWVQTAPTIVDLNNDGQLDFVVATWNFNYKDSVFAYRGDTQARLWAYPIHDHMYHGTAVSDLDNDGKPELVIGSYNDTLYCLNGENGTLSWKYAGSGYIGAPASLGDIDNDGVCDVVFPNGYKITALTNTGTFKWEYPIPNYGSAFRGVALSDINNDSYPDVIFGNSNGILTSLNGNNGSVMWTLNLATHYGNTQFALDHAPLVADFDGDDTLDVFIVGGYGTYPNFSSNFGRAYMISTNKGNGPDLLMFQRDIRRRSSLCIPAINTGFPEINSSERFAVYPNPASTHVTITFDDHEPKRVRIYDVVGKLVYQNILSDETSNVDVHGLKNGLYFIIAEDNKNHWQKKLMIAR
jgi:outer membrane protein assembly factor BamB